MTVPATSTLARGRAGLPWAIATLALFGLPLWLDQAFAVTLLSHVCAMVVFALSYNLLLGQTGLLSFGHAVYAGAGGFAAAHVMNWSQSHGGVLPVVLVPLAGAAAGAVLATVLGYLNSVRGGTPFAMISLALGELVFAVVMMLPEVFGGEAGISTNRVMERPWMGWSFGPDIEAYLLIAGWTLLASLLMYGFVRTPLGQLAAAVRENPQRVGFIGFDARKVRWLVVIVAGLFAGLSGALVVINVEIVSAESVGSWRSGLVLLAVVVGGSGFFAGPVLGAVLVTLGALLLARISPAWQLYLGVLFAGIVLFAPGGVAGASVRAHDYLTATPVSRWWRRAACLLLFTLALGVGASALIEMAYRLRDSAAPGMQVVLAGLRFDADDAGSWVLACLLVLAGAAGLGWRQRLAARRSRLAGPPGGRP